VQQQFAREFGELMPARIQLPSDKELLNFVVTGEWAVLVAKYIIGIAAAISGLVDYAENLYRDVDASLRATRIRGSTIYDALRQRIPQRLAEIADVRARAAFDKWMEEGRPEFLEILSRNVNAIPSELASVPNILHMRAIVAFLCDGDVNGAMRLLNTPGLPRDVVWYYNTGFLHAYQGNMKKAGQCYSKAVVMTHPPDLAARLEAFMTSIVSREPERAQLHYCLGVLNHEVKGDTARAREEFQSFLDRTNADEFKEQRRRAAQLIAQIEADAS
jgi:tetratricopeptide (TPR) repeat protein